MSLEAFHEQVEALLRSLEGTLRPSEVQEVAHLIEHDELGEALRTLAWIIVEEDKHVAPETRSAILELS